VVVGIGSIVQTPITAISDSVDVVARLGCPPGFGSGDGEPTSGPYKLYVFATQDVTYGPTVPVMWLSAP
jgi:hypothetical protein